MDIDNSNFIKEYILEELKHFFYEYLIPINKKNVLFCCFCLRTHAQNGAHKLEYKVF